VLRRTLRKMKASDKLAEKWSLISAAQVGPVSIAPCRSRAIGSSAYEVRPGAARRLPQPSKGNACRLAMRSWDQVDAND
jgi:hypothetical protein